MARYLLVPFDAGPNASQTWTGGGNVGNNTLFPNVTFVGNQQLMDVLYHDAVPVNPILTDTAAVSTTLHGFVAWNTFIPHGFVMPGEYGRNLSGTIGGVPDANFAPFAASDVQPLAGVLHPNTFSINPAWVDLKVSQVFFTLADSAYQINPVAGPPFTSIDAGVTQAVGVGFGPFYTSFGTWANPPYTGLQSGTVEAYLFVLGPSGDATFRFAAQGVGPFGPSFGPFAYGTVQHLFASLDASVLAMYGPGSGFDHIPLTIVSPSGTNDTTYGWTGVATAFIGNFHPAGGGLAFAPSSRHKPTYYKRLFT